MIFFDIITLAVVGWMIYKGYKDGLVSQFLGLLGICLSVFFAVNYGETVGNMLSIDAQYASITGFVIIFVGALLAIFLLSKLITGTLSLIKLEWLNSILGSIFAVIKGLVILGMLYAAVFALNARTKTVEPEEFDSSISFNIVRKAANPLLNYWERTKPIEQLTTQEE